MGLVTRRRFSVAVWVIGVLVAVVWGTTRQAGVQVQGIAQARTVHVAALETGRLAELPVALHDPVDAGTVVARLEARSVEEERRIAAAELLALQEELASDAVDRSRRFADSREEAALDAAEARVALAEDQASLGTLKEQLRIERALLADGATSESSVQAIEWQIGVVQARIAAERSTLEAARNLAAGTADRLDAATTPADGWRVTAAARRLEALEGRLARLELRSTLSGTVSWVHHQPGDVVRQGDPILDVSEAGTREVVGYLPAALADRAVVGSKARVVRASGQALQAEVRSVGATLRPVPTLIQRNPAVPEWGVPVRVELMSEAVLRPDEPVTVRL